jgi:formylglycine-generating enzyme required for sulfatase activity
MKHRKWILTAVILSGGLGLGVQSVSTWMWKKGVTVQYAASIARARLHFIDVLDPEKDMVKISGGTFKRSDGRNESRVTLRPFKISKNEVTFEQYNRFVELTGSRQPSDEAKQKTCIRWRREVSFRNGRPDPSLPSCYHDDINSGFGREKHPVINVSWKEATDYAHWLSRATGKSYRLLTEAEWEYAARSGGKDEIWAGTSDEKQLAEYAVFGRLGNKENKEGFGTERVGSRKPNGLGLNDMSGNVWEWVEDCWHENYNGAPTDGRAWKEENGGECGRRVIRGGSWSDDPVGVSLSNRARDDVDFSFTSLGFRLAQDLN